MPTTRMIDPQIWKSESMAKLTFRQRLLFIGLFSNADDQGRCRANPALVRSTVFPYDEISADEIAADLKAIDFIESIKLYTDNGVSVLQILNWWKYQHPQWAYPSNITPIDGWNDRLRYRRGEREVVTKNWDGLLPNQLPNQLPNNATGAIELELGIGLEVEKVSGAKTAPAKPRKSTKRDERTDTPAIQACYKTVGKYPPLGLYDRLIGALGNAPDIQRLTECHTAWLERGYNSQAWTWATEWYVSGVPSRNGHSQHGKGPHGAGVELPSEVAARRALERSRNGKL